jgi:hypothetical protein
MDGRTGEAISPNDAEMVPDGVLQFAERLIEKHGLREYREIAEGAWRWIKEDTLATFRFEGQFEDTSRGGGRRWNLSHYPAANIAAYLLRHSADDPSYIAIGEEALRFAEDQFVIWDHAADADARRDGLPGVSLGPWVLEQYAYMVPITGSAANMMDAYAAAYEATGKELYLAKAITFANAMTVILKKNGGKYVGAFWNSDRPGGWPNVHQYSARALARLDETLRRRNVRVAVREGGTAAAR